MGKRHITEHRGEWRVHTPNLLKEVLSNESAAILSVPLNIFWQVTGSRWRSRCPAQRPRVKQADGAAHDLQRGRPR